MKCVLRECVFARMCLAMRARRTVTHVVFQGRVYLCQRGVEVAVHFGEKKSGVCRGCGYVAICGNGAD